MKVLVHVVEKSQERTKLKFSIVCCVLSISLITLVWGPDIARKLFEILVDRLFDGNWLTTRVSDNTKKQMKTFLLAVKYEFWDQFLGFPQKEPLDKFPSKFCHRNNKYCL